MNKEALDAVVIENIGRDWRKVALVIARVLELYERQTTEGEIASAIQRLVQSGRLLGRGDLNSWRQSEVKLGFEGH